MRSKRAVILGCGLALLALAGCSSGANQQRLARPTWPPGAYIGPSWPVATYVFLDPPNPGGDVRAASADADAVIGAAGRYLPTRDFALLLPDPRNEQLVVNPTIRMLRLLAYARARSPAPVWLVGTMQDLDLVLHGVPAISPHAFAGFVLLPMSAEGCGTPAQMQEQGLDGMPTVVVGMGSAACLSAPRPMATLPPPSPIIAPYHPPLGVMPVLPPSLQASPPAAAPDMVSPAPSATTAPDAASPEATAPAATAPETTGPETAPPTATGANTLPLPPVPPAAPGAKVAAPALPANMPFQRVSPITPGNLILKTAPKPPVTSQPLPGPAVTPPPAAPAPSPPPANPGQTIPT
ncbi:MAG: hypothetical protein LGL72_07965 [Acidibrevibacterium sp.]|uniref:hypothetical protein n=1 Tax=Acidibrevibacterium fodinaquatile TaxID=1969806 RepID=UPI0023A90878|nr:hypothetical protein [Acidibrevibacterium fodinaquatile]MCA7119329.1 hypothetical protein [Acidibrevibacterium fodinaquatile]